MAVGDLKEEEKLVQQELPFGEKPMSALGLRYLKTALLLKDPSASYQDLLDIWNGPKEEKGTEGNR